jgi:hypothetical protein
MTEQSAAVSTGAPPQAGGSDWWRQAVVYLYQGEELGLPEVAGIPDAQRQDPTFFRTSGARAAGTRSSAAVRARCAAWFRPWSAPPAGARRRRARRG